MKNLIIMIVYTCPDCGRKFEEGFVPSECSNCGCPSSYFVQKKKSDRSTTSILNKNINIKTLIIIVSICLAVGVGYAIISSAQEKAAHEQYVKEQNEQRAREAAEAKRIEQENEKFLDKIVGVYSSSSQYYRGEDIRYRIILSSNKRYTIEIVDYRNRILSSQSGRFSVVASERGIVLNPNTSNSSWISVVGSHLEWGDIDLY